GLADEAVADVFARHLESDALVEARVVRAVDDGLPAGAEDAFDDVRPRGIAGRERQAVALVAARREGGRELVRAVADGVGRVGRDRLEEAGDPVGRGLRR